jgi:hypothetical protein
MDITSGIARASMDLALTKVGAEAQTAMLKNVMDLQKESLSILLESMGVGRNLNVRA